MRDRLPPRARREEPQDDDVGAHEEHDEPLDQERQVRRELGLEDLGVEVARRRAGHERAEEERGEERRRSPCFARAAPPRSR